MIVPDSMRKSVVFIGYRMDNGDMKFAGSAFFLGKSVGNRRSDYVHLITAKHVIDRIRKYGLQHVLIRVNLKNGESAWYQTETSDWKYHPTDLSVDVAVTPCGIPDDWDHLVFPTSMVGTPQQLAAKELSLGDELFIVGLFHHHAGTKRNIPIIRVGNLSALAEEKVEAKEFGYIDAYLIEARSIGGLSGSPVFVDFGPAIRGIGGVRHMLLGLIHGHYDQPSPELGADTQDISRGLTTERINTGIAIVVPCEKIVEVLDSQIAALEATKST
jgi:hypothetical protein